MGTQPLLELQCGWVGITASTAFDWRHVSFPKEEVTQGPAPRDSLRDSLRPPHFSLVRTSLMCAPLSHTRLSQARTCELCVDDCDEALTSLDQAPVASAEELAAATEELAAAAEELAALSSW